MLQRVHGHRKARNCDAGLTKENAPRAKRNGRGGSNPYEQQTRYDVRRSADAGASLTEVSSPQVKSPQAMIAPVLLVLS
jgi:hypothetical protein